MLEAVIVVCLMGFDECEVGSSIVEDCDAHYALAKEEADKDDTLYIRKYICGKSYVQLDNEFVIGITEKD